MDTATKERGSQRYTTPSGVVVNELGDVISRPGDSTKVGGGVNNEVYNATATPAGSLVDRYSVGKRKLDESAVFDMPKPDETMIREQARLRAQSAVNAINAKFSAIEAADRETLDLMNRERRAANVMQGLSGSTPGAARTIETATKGAQLQKNTAAQKAAELEAVFADAEARGSAEFENKRKEYIATQKDRLAAEQALSSRVETAALDELATFASNRMSFDDLKTKRPDLIAQYQRETGKDEEALRSYFLTKIPKADLLSENGTKLGDGSVAFHQKIYDDAGNVTGLKEIMKIQGDKPIETTSISPEGIFVLYKDGTTEFKSGYTGKKAEKVADKETVISGTLRATPELLSESERELQARTGSDGYVDTPTYLLGLNNWIKEGGLQQDFFKQFDPKRYLNPNDPTVPPALRQYLKVSQDREV